MVYDLIRELRDTSKRKEKIEILKSIKETDLEEEFLRVAELTYSPYIDFYTKEYEFSEDHEGSIDLEEALQRLKALSDRLISGNEAIALLEETDRQLSQEDAEVFRLIVRRDLLCGAAPKTINSVWKDHIYIHPYMRANSFNKKNLAKINYPCISQTKEDGKYIDIINTGDSVDIMSRSGSFLNHYATDDVKEKFFHVNETVFMGEILVLDQEDPTKYMPRKAGNGYINQNDETIDPERLVFVLWDAVDYNEWKSGKTKTPYTERFAELTSLVRVMDHPRIRLIDSRIVEDVDGIIEHAKENISAGLEGTVIKNLDLQWKDGTSTDQVKVKIQFECDLEVVETKEGEKGSKYEGMVGSVRCVSSDGIVDVWVGGGYKDEERENLPFGVGDIIEVRANDIINNETEEGKYSLFLPRFRKVRKDKTEADSYDRVVEQRDSFIHTLEVIGD